MNIAIDIMGGDYAPRATVLGAVMAQKELPANVKLILIGDQAQIIPLLEEFKAPSASFQIVHSTEVIGMGEHPTRAIFPKTQIHHCTRISNAKGG